MKKCPECGKSHRPGKTLEKCAADARYALDHYIIRGLKEDDPLMIKARVQANAFETYANGIGQRRTK